MDVSNKTTQIQKRKKWFFFLLATTTLLIFFTLLISFNSKTPFNKTPHKPKPTSSNHKKNPTPQFVESKLKILPTLKNPIPRIAYLISGSRGDGESLKRTLKAIYHPLNQYALHLDLEAPPSERLELVGFVEKESVFSRVGNVRVVSKSNLVTYRGPTMVTNTLHAMAILMKDAGDWDWFINLSASDYPLVTQDDLLHVLSTIPRELNFIEHTNDIGWKEFGRARPVIIDPGLYSSQKSEVFSISEHRGMPTAFKLFTGSAWMMVSRPFVEYILWGWDNLPRTILMYYANFISSPEGYFHTVVCNVDEFKNTTVNSDLHFISWDNPPQQHPHFLTTSDFQRMLDSNAPFARKFAKKEPVLDKIDSEILGRNASSFSSAVMNTTALRPGQGAVRLKRLITKLLSEEYFHPRQCTNVVL